MSQTASSKNVSKASSKADDYGSFLSDSQKNEDTCDSNAEIPSEFKSNLDKIMADDYEACAEECEKNGETTTPNEIEGKLDERKVKFDIQINRPNNFKPREISFEEIDKYDFEKGFIEFILTEKYVHLYFDFDSISSEDDFISVIDWLDGLTEVFGPYTYGGYTNDETIAADYEFRHFPDGKHFISMHAIFYQTCISTSDLVSIMKHTEKKGFSTKGVHPLCDPNVYKLVPRSGKDGSRQLFRHVLSDKIGCKEPSMNHGSLIDEAKPSDHIVQIRGNEPIISKAKWSSLFTLDKYTLSDQSNAKSNAKSPTNLVKRVVEISSEFSDLDAHDDLITLTDEEVLELLNEFPPEFDKFQKITINLLHSPYEESHARELLEKWYNQKSHTNGCPIDGYIYEEEHTNKWFFAMLKHLSDDRRNYYLNKYAKRSINPDAKINFKDTFSLTNMHDIDYTLQNGKGINVSKFISDLKRCVAFIVGPPMKFIVKKKNEKKECIEIKICDLKEFAAELNAINLGKYLKNGKWKNINAYQVYNEGKNKNYIKKNDICFYSANPKVFSYFVGYDYNLLDNVDGQLIKPFFDHIREIIAENNEELFQYIINWVSYIFQKPSGQNGTAIVIIGFQGGGKNIFTNTICKLLGDYANKNLNQLEHIIGKFNIALENKKLIICNELCSADNNKNLNSDALKSVITESTIMMNSKGVDAREIQNVVNLIILSNNFAPVRIENGDRRYVVTHASTKYKDNDEYFEPLYKLIEDKTFLDNLFTFFMKRDLSNYNPRKIPITETKKALQDASKSAYELFIQHYIKDFIKGIKCKEAYNLYSTFVNDNGFKKANTSTFKSYILMYTDYKQICIDGSRPRVYILKDECKKFFDLNVNEDGEEFDDENAECI